MGTDLSDDQWVVIAPLLPKACSRGRPRADDRRTINGILFVLRTGCRWQDLPKEYGHHSTCWRRLRRWEGEGVWDRVWRALLKTLDERGKLEWAQAFLDGSFVPAKRGALV